MWKVRRRGRSSRGRGVLLLAEPYDACTRAIIPPRQRVPGRTLRHEESLALAAAPELALHLRCTRVSTAPHAPRPALHGTHLELARDGGLRRLLFRVRPAAAEARTKRHAHAHAGWLLACDKRRSGPDAGALARALRRTLVTTARCRARSGSVPVGGQMKAPRTARRAFTAWAPQAGRGEQAVAQDDGAR